MFTVTEAARIRLAKKLDKRRASDDEVLRFARKRRCWKLRLDKPASGDVLFTHKGRTVLVLVPKAAKRLADRALDARDTAAGSRLYLR
ncbi:MAG: hypothetical protein JXQ75_00855 [Phycisphaerae bacterium]|nr:hypothetical protein [Phycisphaerae bacterium]